MENISLKGSDTNSRSKMHYKIITLFLISSIFLVNGKEFAIDENWVCSVKKSCLDCLRLSQCTWCAAEETCFSTNIRADYCSYERTNNVDHGFSFEDNAKCNCEADQFTEESCRQLDSPVDDPVCSGRGKCVCGKCACDQIENPDEPTSIKMILGEFCEFDNFSCDGPHCSEGPYSLSEVNTYSEMNATTSNE